MKFDAYGRKIEVVRNGEAWIVFYLGNEGKKRTAHDVFIPSHVKDGELKQYLEDVLHEWATPANSDISVIDS